MFYSLQKQHKHSEERSFGRFIMSLKCDRMFILVSSKCNPVKWASSTMRVLSSAQCTDVSGKFNNASAHRALVDWYLSLFVMCKA